MLGVVWSCSTIMAYHVFRENLGLRLGIGFSMLIILVCYVELSLITESIWSRSIYMVSNVKDYDI